jgi:hypothetical protein
MQCFVGNVGLHVCITLPDKNIRSVRVRTKVQQMWPTFWFLHHVMFGIAATAAYFAIEE